MQEILNLILTNKKWVIGTVLTLIALYFGYRRYKIMSEKSKIDKTDFENKKPNFFLYFHQGYRLFDKDKKKLKFLLINIDISNKSTSKITVTPYIYIKLKEVQQKIKLFHNSQLFLEKYHSKIEKFENHVIIEERGKKSGWIISKIPNELVDQRIEYIDIICEDTLGNISKVKFYLLKDIYFEDKKN